MLFSSTFVDIAYILKLKSRPRPETLLSQLPNSFLYEVEGIKMNGEGEINVSIWSIFGHNHTNPVSLDITKNFIDMIKHAYYKQYHRVLFLEEDAMFSESISPSKLSFVENWLSHYDTRWDVFYLGYCNWPYPCSWLINPHVVKVSCPLLTHSFILNRRGMEKILNYTEYGKLNMNQHFDKMIGTCIKSLQRYAIYPMISFQSKNPALLQKALDKLNMQLSCRTLCRWNEHLSLFLPILLLCCFIYFILKITFFST